MSLLRRLTHRIQAIAQQIDRALDVIDRDLDRSSSSVFGVPPVEGSERIVTEARLWAFRLFSV